MNVYTPRMEEYCPRAPRHLVPTDGHGRHHSANDADGVALFWQGVEQGRRSGYLSRRRGCWGSVVAGEPFRFRGHGSWVLFDAVRISQMSVQRFQIVIVVTQNQAPFEWRKSVLALQLTV